MLDGHTLFSGSMDRTVCVWDVEHNFALEQVLRGHTEAVTCMAIADTNHAAGEKSSSEGKLICSGSFDTTIRIWSST